MPRARSPEHATSQNLPHAQPDALTMNPVISPREKREPSDLERFWGKRIADAQRAVDEAEKALAAARDPIMQRYAFHELQTKRSDLERAYRQR